MTMAGAARAPPSMRVVSAVRYLSPTEVIHLATATGVNQSSTLARRQMQMLGLIQALGGRIGFPQRTVATAQLLYQRFHLFYNPRDFIAHEVAIACTVVAAKMCDTPKKARDVILHSWALRYPELARIHPASAASSTTQSSAAHASAATTPKTASPAQTPSSSTLGLGIVSESDIDPGVLEKERKRVVSIESLLLQGIAFNFNTTVRDNLRYVVKIARDWQIGREIGRLAWQVAADCHRTYAPMCYPPATIALASIYAAVLLSQKSGGSASSDAHLAILARFAGDGGSGRTTESEWQARFLCTIDDVEAVVLQLIDMYEGAAAQLATASSAAITPISPATPASPSELDARSGGAASISNAAAAAHRKLPAHFSSPPPFGMLFWASEIAPTLAEAGVHTDAGTELTQIKIFLRQAEDVRKRQALEGGHGGASAAHGRPALGGAAAAGHVPLRPLDIGGVRGDVNALSSAHLDDAELQRQWELRAQDKQLSSLQRFLF